MRWSSPKANGSDLSRKTLSCLNARLMTGLPRPEHPSKRARHNEEGTGEWELDLYIYYITLITDLIDTTFATLLVTFYNLNNSNNTHIHQSSDGNFISIAI